MTRDEILLEIKDAIIIWDEDPGVMDENDTEQCSEIVLSRLEGKGVLKIEQD